MLWYNTKLFKEAGISGPPTTFAAMAADSKKITALSTPSKPVYGLSFAGACQGCLGFVMLPDIWASGQHLLVGPLGKQTANITEQQAARGAAHGLPADLGGQGGARGRPDPERQHLGPGLRQGNVGMLPGDYGFFNTFLKEKLPASDFADAPLPSMNGGHGSTFDGGDDFVIPAKAKNASGAWEVAQWFLAKAQQTQYPGLGDSPVRNDIVTPAFLAKYPYEKVPIDTLKYGSVEYTLAYDQVFNEPGSPWSKMFDEAVFSGNVQGRSRAGRAGSSPPSTPSADSHRDMAPRPGPRVAAPPFPCFNRRCP